MLYTYNQPINLYYNGSNLLIPITVVVHVSVHWKSSIVHSMFKGKLQQRRQTHQQL